MKLPAVLVALAALLGPASAQTNTAPRRADIANETGGALREVYISPTNDANWGPDRLTSSTIAVGEVRRLETPATGACMFDIRVTYAQRPREEHLRADLCRNSRVVINGSGRVITRGDTTCREALCIAPNARGFMLRYNPIRCVRAPCPPGSYIITVAGREVARAGALRLNGADRSRHDLIAGVGIEGTWTLDRASNSLTVNAATVRDGEWKP